MHIYRLLCALALYTLCCKGLAQELRPQGAILAAAQDRLQRAERYTLEVAAAMPAQRYDLRPADSMMTFAGQLAHLSANLTWLSSVLGDTIDPTYAAELAGSDKEAVLELLERSYAFAKRQMLTIDAPELAEEVDFFAGPLTRLQLLLLLNDHQAHHRGQLVVYLRLAGADPPRYVGW